MKRSENNQEDHGKNSALTFFIGLVMLVAGLFWLTQIVEVSTSWFNLWRVGGVPIGGGLTLVPLIVGIVWLFFNPKSIWPKIITVLGGVILIASIIMSLNFHVQRTSLFVFIIIFVMVAGGSGLLLRTLFRRK